MKRKLLNKIKKIYHLNDLNYYQFIINFLNEDQLNILRMKNYNNVFINVKTLLDLDLITYSKKKYYIKKDIYDLAFLTKPNKFINYFEGIINAYGVINKDYFKYPYLDLIILIKKDIKFKHNYIYKDCLKKINICKLKRFKSYELKMIANDTYYKHTPSYQPFNLWYKNNIEIDNRLFDNIITKIYLYYYQINEFNYKNRFINYLNYLNLITDDYKRTILLYYLDRISKEIPLWRYGGYSFNEKNML